MADPRRSARSTKGVNPRLNELSPSPAPPSSAKRRKTTPAAPATTSKSQSPGAAGADAEKGPSDDIIRCVCGAKEEDEDDDRMMIQCEGCDAWQHTQCMAITKKKIPKQYFCEVCRPDQHVWLLEQMAKGERPWENPKGAARLRAAAERKQHLEEEKRQKEEEAARIANGGASATQQPPQPEPMDSNTEVPSKDREATVPAEPTLRQDTIEDVQEKIKGVDLKKKSLTHIETQSPAPHPRGKRESRTPKSAKRKASEDSDMEYKEEGAEPERKMRRTSAHTVASPTSRESSVHPKTPRADHSRRQSTAQGAGHKASISHDDTSPQTELVRSVEELRNSTRQKTVAFLTSFMTDSTKKLGQNNQLELSEGDNLEVIVQNKALEIEHHVYMNHFDGGRLVPEYNKRLRSIGVNLKQNPELTKEVISGRLSCERLSHMTTEEMQSKELKEFTQKALLESEKQHTLINTETGPRIRRTHKGEEIVDDFNTTTEDTLLDTGPIVRRNTEQMDETPPFPATSAPPESPKPQGDTSMSPPGVSASHTPRSISRPPTASADAQPTSAEPTPSDPARKFSIENVWSHVETPDASSRPASQFRPPPLQPTTPAGTKIDRDIDALLKDDDIAPASTPPYSPKAFTPEARFSPPPNTPHWRGTVTMSAIASLNAVATLLGGPGGVGNKTWPDLLDTNLSIDGRIKLDRATEYLCGQKFSRSSSLITALLHPATSAPVETAGFDKLFDYFAKKERYAVVGKHQLQCIKDLYIVPCDIEKNGPPDWFSVLDPPPKESDLPRGKCLVLVFVVIRALVDGAQPVYPQQQQQVLQQTPLHQQHHQSNMGLQYGTPIQPLPSPYITTPFVNPANQLAPQQQHGMYPHQPPQPPPPPQFGQPTPPHHHSPLQEQGPYIPVHPMTKELIQMVPGLGELQVRAIDRLLQENPDLQTQPEVLAKEVEKVLGAEQP
ncbi:hypothetical protein EX30DRAFT_315005 [Ascodesmis nigricans]|uniref:Transcription factor BYE1 n=1 Tax=Ascodesmis nigricans TaxID=341454 RepID=A0A4V6RHJ6_9PEZI|nr:hypothetical protein EX30DRAFT_315005 [Ascodesmis nigricans]